MGGSRGKSGDFKAFFLVPPTTGALDAVEGVEAFVSFEAAPLAFEAVVADGDGVVCDAVDAEVCFAVVEVVVGEVVAAVAGAFELVFVLAFSALVAAAASLAASAAFRFSSARALAARSRSRRSFSRRCCSSSFACALAAFSAFLRS